MKPYDSLYKQYKGQLLSSVFSHFYAINGDYDEPYKVIARQTIDGLGSWTFKQDRFKNKYTNTSVPKLKNYLNYTFRRLVELEISAPGQYFVSSTNLDWVAFNTGLHNQFGADMLAVFQRYKRRDGDVDKIVPDWVYKCCCAPNDGKYREHFGARHPDIAWYSLNSRDYVFDVSYRLEHDGFDHLFERAKERAGLPNAPDEAVRNYLRGALENLVPKIKRNYKTAIPVYYVEEKRMQLLLPFFSANDSNDISCFLVDRDDKLQAYRLKTIFDLDQAVLFGTSYH